MTYDSWSRRIYDAVSTEARDRKLLEGGTGQDNATFSSNVTFSLYSDSEAGFQIEYPSNWLPEKDKEEEEGDVIFTSPLESSNDKYPGKIRVSLGMDMPKIFPLQELARGILDSLNKSNILAGTYTESATIGRYPAIEVHYMIVGNENVEESILVGFIGKKMVQFHLKAYNFNRCKPILDRMASSFRLI
jgi:hypothetical protein